MAAEPKRAKLETVPQPAKPHELRLIGRDAYKPREQVANHWVVRVRGDVTEADLTNPALWANAPNGMQSFDLIRVIGPRLWAEVLVRKFIPPGVCQMVVLRAIELPEAEEDNADATPPGHEIYCDDVHGWTVKRISDAVILGDAINHPEWRSRRDALRWLQDHATLRQRPST